MDIRLVRATIDDAEFIWKMQVDSFMSLYEKYQDTDTSPATDKETVLYMKKWVMFRQGKQKKLMKSLGFRQYFQEFEDFDEGGA